MTCPMIELQENRTSGPTVVCETMWVICQEAPKTYNDVGTELRKLLTTRPGAGTILIRPGC